MRQLVSGLVLLFGATACTQEASTPNEAQLLENGAYVTLHEFGGETFLPEGNVEAVEIVWFTEWNDDLVDPVEALGPGERCTTASNQDRCIELLTAAVHEFDRERIAADGEGGMYADRFSDGNCIMCEVIGGYLFAVRQNTASVVTFAEARAILGDVDTPGEVMVHLEEIGLVRQVDNGYEVILKDMVCDPRGPRHTAWNIDRDGTVTEVSNWFDELGEDCDEI